MYLKFYNFYSLLTVGGLKFTMIWSQVHIESNDFRCFLQTRLFLEYYYPDSIVLFITKLPLLLGSVHLFSLLGYTLSIAMSQENEPTSKDRDEFKFLNLNLY